MDPFVCDLVDLNFKLLKINFVQVWRYLFDPEDSIAGYYKHKSSAYSFFLSTNINFSSSFAAVATLSGPGGSTLRTFDALTGQLLIEKRLHLPEIGLHSEPAFIGKHVIFSPRTADIYVLSNGYTVTNIDGKTGDVKWSTSSPDKRFISSPPVVVFLSQLFCL
jgi:ER membrane protein complex subunit 1